MVCSAQCAVRSVQCAVCSAQYALSWDSFSARGACMQAESRGRRVDVPARCAVCVWFAHAVCATCGLWCAECIGVCVVCGGSFRARGQAGAHAHAHGSSARSVRCLGSWSLGRQFLVDQRRAPTTVPPTQIRSASLRPRVHRARPGTAPAPSTHASAPSTLGTTAPCAFSSHPPIVHRARPSARGWSCRGCLSLVVGG